MPEIFPRQKRFSKPDVLETFFFLRCYKRTEGGVDWNRWMSITDDRRAMWMNEIQRWGCEQMKTYLL